MHASCKQMGSRALPFVTEGQALLEQQLLPSQSPVLWTSGVLGDLSEITLCLRLKLSTDAGV